MSSKFGRVGGALVAVPAAAYDEAQVVDAGEVDGGGDVGGTTCRDGVGARTGGPGVGPAQRLGEAGLVADVVRIGELAKQRLTSAGVVAGRAGGERGPDLDEMTADLAVERIPLRGCRPAGVSGAHPAHGARAGLAGRKKG